MVLRLSCAWELLAERLWTIGQEGEALQAFEVIQRLDPDHVRAGLYVAMGRHDEGLRSGQTNWQEVRVVLECAQSHPGSLQPAEENLSKLYWCSTQLRLGVAGSAVLPELDKVSVEALSSGQRELLAQSYRLAGNLEEQAGKFAEALCCYTTSLGVADQEGTRKQLVSVLTRQGDALFQARKYRGARREYQKALGYSPEDVGLREKGVDASRKLRQRELLIAGIAVAAVAIAAFCGGFLYYGQGALEIQSKPAAKISLFHGEELLKTAEGERLGTGLLRYGSYELRIEKEGYETLREKVKPQWGRVTKTVVVELSPRYGALKIASEPSGAKVKVRNKYQVENGVTPCVIKDLFALPSTIEVVHTQFSPYKSEKEIIARETLDLGIIAFKGGLKVDSDPSEAEVYVDGVLKGKTPFAGNDFPARSLKLEIRKLQAGAYIDKVVVEPGKTVDLRTVKLSNKGGLRITSKPPGAKVKVDENEVGITPLVVPELEAKTHMVRFVLPGYPSRYELVKIEPSQVMELNMSLLGSLKVDSDPNGAEIYLDGRKVGATPTTIEDLPALETRLELKLDGYEPSVATAKVEPDKVTNLALIRLKKGFQPQDSGQQRPGNAGIDQVITRFYLMVEQKRVNDAIDMFASAKKPNIKRNVIESVAKDTEYYRIQNIRVVEQDTSNAKTQVYLLHKKYRSSEEKWQIDISLIKENGEWKLWSTPGKRL